MTAETPTVAETLQLIEELCKWRADHESRHAILRGLPALRAAVQVAAQPPAPTDWRNWHGHVRQRPDGRKARCGGPALCAHCRAEQDALSSTPQPAPPIYGPIDQAKDAALGERANVLTIRPEEARARQPSDKPGEYRGQFLKEVRASRGLTLRDVERVTDGKISSAYLSQLENGGIEKPSAIMLHRLSSVYAIDYHEIMEKAGFVPKSELLMERAASVFGVLTNPTPPAAAANHPADAPIHVYDDGTTVHLEVFSGAHPKFGPWDSVDLAFTLADGTETVATYRPAVTPPAAAEGWRPIDDRAKNLPRIILGWNDSATLPMHWEVGHWSHQRGGWVNSYGHPFAGSPTHYCEPLPAPPHGAGER